MNGAAFAFSVRGLEVEIGAVAALQIDVLEVPAGQITAVVGPNGAGKTTLLEGLAGLRRVRAQRFLFFGEPVIPGTSSWEELRRRATYVAQRPLLFRRSVYANVAYGLRVRGENDEERIERALARVGLEGFGSRPAWKLSTGEAQRVAIARALAIDPPVYLFDEPTANLDRDSTPEFEVLLRELAQRGRTVVFSTHTLDQAYRLGDRILSLEHGRVGPFPLVNLVRGRLRVDGGEAILQAGGIEIVLPTDPPAKANAKVAVAIDPESILLSREPLRSSARNSFSGVVVGIEGSAAGFLVRVDCGVEFVARITARAFAELGLAIGQPVVVTFKSSAVHWIEPSASSHHTRS
jgi:molybdopterin-binding protein